LFRVFLCVRGIDQAVPMMAAPMAKVAAESAVPKRRAGKTATDQTHKSGDKQSGKAEAAPRGRIC